jgi:hypothetical protein
MKERVMDGVFLFVIIICIFGLIVAWGEGERLKKDNLSWSLSKAERKHIMKELDAKGVGDCTLEPVPGGWVCKDANGNIFKVKR